MADAPPPSKKQRRKQEKARWLAERKAAHLAEGNAPSKRKRRNQRQSRSTASAAPSAAVHYNVCTSTTCANRVAGSVCVVRSIEPYVHRFALFAKGRWAGRTLGELFASEFPTLSSAYCVRAARLGLIRVNGEVASLDSVIKGGDFFEHLKHRHEPSVHLPVESDKDMTSLSKRWIHFETDELMVVDKPSGIPVHPTGSYQLNSLTVMLQHDRREGAGVEGFNEAETLELFPVHRLDRLTSGLLILAKTAEKARSLTAELTATSSGEGAGTRSVQKYYVARVKGEFPDTEVGFAGVEGMRSGLVTIEKADKGFWRMTAPIGMKSPRQDHTRCVVDSEDSKPCVTLLRRRGEAVGGESIVECLLVTGRTHQIRVHLQHLGFPIANDPMYGSKTGEGAKAATEQGSKVAPTLAFGSSPYLDEGEEGDSADDEQRCIRVCDSCTVDEKKTGFVGDTVLWLHSYRYESPKWSFEVPLPHWAALQ